MIDISHQQLSISKQCELLAICRSSFYYQAKDISAEDLNIMKRIDEIYTAHPYYGTRRMSQCLQAEGYAVGRKALRRYYRIMALETIYPKMNLSKRNKAHAVYPYLLRDLEVTRTNQVWSTDITYIRLTQGFVYLVAIIDWYSRYVLSWRTSVTLDSEFCVDALEEALAKYGTPEIFNTDQGVQFTSNKFLSVLSSGHVKISMDGKGRALDNVFIERFWRSLKQEKIYLIILTSPKEAKYAINDYMIFYNTERLHQSLGYQTPETVHFNKRKFN